MGVDLSQYRTDDERLIVNHWSRGWAAGFVRKLQRMWVVSDLFTGGCPGVSFKTKRDALAFIDTFVLEVIPRRCRERAGVE